MAHLGDVEDELGEEEAATATATASSGTRRRRLGRRSSGRRAGCGGGATGRTSGGGAGGGGPAAAATRWSGRRMRQGSLEHGEESGPRGVGGGSRGGGAGGGGPAAAAAEFARRRRRRRVGTGEDFVLFFFSICAFRPGVVDIIRAPLRRRHDISVGVNIPSTCACLKAKESLCEGNAATPVKG